MSWFYRGIIRPVLFTQEAEKIHDRTLRLLAAVSRNKLLLDLARGALWRAGFAGRAFRVALSQSGRPGGGHGQMGARRAGVARAWDLVSANWGASPGTPNPAIRPRVSSAPWRTKRWSTAWGSTIPARRPSPQALARWKAEGRWPAHPVGVNLGKSKMTPLENAPDGVRQHLSPPAAPCGFLSSSTSARPTRPTCASLQDKAALDEILAAMQQNNTGAAADSHSGRRSRRTSRSRPWTKSWNWPAPRHLAGIVATNTTITRPTPGTRGCAEIYAQPGGLSGRPLRQRSTEVIRHLYRQSRRRLADHRRGRNF